jgi:hypothetical protein
MILRAMLAIAGLLVGPHAGQVKVMILTKRDTLVLGVGGWACG